MCKIKFLSIIKMCFLFANIINAANMSLSSSSSQDEKPIPLKYAQADYVANALPELLKGKIEGEIKVTIDSYLNILKVVASPKDFEVIVEIVSKLDDKKKERPIEELIKNLST